MLPVFLRVRQWAWGWGSRVRVWGYPSSFSVTSVFSIYFCETQAESARLICALRFISRTADLGYQCFPTPGLGPFTCTWRCSSVSLIYRRYTRRANCHSSWVVIKWHFSFLISELWSQIILLSKGKGRHALQQWCQTYGSASRLGKCCQSIKLTFHQSAALVYISFYFALS